MRCAHAASGRGSDGEHRRAAEGGEHLGQVEIGAALARGRGSDMVRLVHGDKAHAPGGGEALAVDREELGSRQHDVERALGERAEDLRTRRLGGIAREHAHADAPRAQKARQMEGLVGDEGAQGVHEDARTAVEDGPRGRRAPGIRATCRDPSP